MVLHIKLLVKTAFHRCYYPILSQCSTSIPPNGLTNEQINLSQIIFEAIFIETFLQSNV